MWRRLLYLVCIVEAGVLAAILAALVIDPSLAGSALTPRMRQLCAWGALVLILGSGFAAVRWLGDLMASVHEGVTVRRETASRGSMPGAVDLEQRQSEEASRDGRDGRAA